MTLPALPSAVQLVAWHDPTEYRPPNPTEAQAKLPQAPPGYMEDVPRFRTGGDGMRPDLLDRAMRIPLAQSPVADRWNVVADLLDRPGWRLLVIAPASTSPFDALTWLGSLVEPGAEWRSAALADLLIRVAQRPNVESAGRHPDCPDVWVWRDGKQLVSETLAGARVMRGLRKRPRLTAWVAYVPDLVTAITAINATNSEPVTPPRVNTGGAPAISAAVERLYLAVLALHGRGQRHKATAQLAGENAAIREQLDEANRGRQPGDRLVLDDNFVKRVLSWNHQRKERKGQKGQEKRTGRRG